MKESNALKAASIEEITIETNPRWLKVCNISNPASALESKFSYRHSCALVFSGYNSSALSTYSKECCNDQCLDRIRQLTQVIANEALTDTASSVRIELTDGKVYETTYELANILLTPIREQKVLGKSRVLLGDSVTTGLWSFIQNIELKTTS